MTGAAPAKVALIGASGFIGSATRAALGRSALEVRSIPTPRLTTTAGSSDALLAEARRWSASSGDGLRTALEGCDVIVNCAGLAAPDSAHGDRLLGANALLPAVLAHAGGDVGARRLVHVSSAAVQGRSPVLDESDRTAAFSAYSRSKALGEAVLLASGETAGRLEVVRYRPTSVHGAHRTTTRQLARLARSRLSSVAGDGNAPTPQVLLDDVARAIVLLVLAADAPDGAVLHPWEGLTTAQFLTLLGRGKVPVHFPERAARAAARLGAAVPVARVRGASRRLDMLWFGQAQDCRTLSDLGYRPTGDTRPWDDMARSLTDL